MRSIVAALLCIGGAGYAHDTQSSHCHGGLVKHKCPNNPQLLEGKPDATGYWCTNSDLHWTVRYACTWLWIWWGGGGCGWFVLRDIAPFVANMSRGAHYFLYRLCTRISRVTVLTCYKHHLGFNLCKHVCLSKASWLRHIGIVTLGCL